MQRKTRKLADGLLFGMLRNSKFIRYTGVNELKTFIRLQGRHLYATAGTQPWERLDRETAHLLLASPPVPAQVREALMIT